jgi:L-rhamnose mutarotase
MGKSKETIPEYGLTNPSPEEKEKNRIKRFGSVIGLKPEKEQYYRKLHANTWPSVIERLKRSNVQNFSIYFTELEGKRYLFSYFEYTGNDYERDMKLIAEDSETRKWWKETAPCQIQLPTRKLGANWSEMEMVFLME